MKKIVRNIAIAALAVGFAASAVAAGKLLQFSSVVFYSQGPDDVVSIAIGDSAVDYAVNINVNNSYGGAGVNVKNCGVINHINPGSGVVCQIKVNMPVMIASDKAGVQAMGSYQISN